MGVWGRNLMKASPSTTVAHCFAKLQPFWLKRGDCRVADFNRGGKKSRRTVRGMSYAVFTNSTSSEISTASPTITPPPSTIGL
jgi:hypothetical protein